MSGLSKYWQICRLSLTNNQGYEFQEITAAQELSQELSSTETINLLLSLFKSKSSVAGLCLRCYVSYSILKSCQKLAALFSSNHNFSYHDLLPFVLNDDGKREIMLAEDGKTQLIIDRDGNTQVSQYKLFTVEIIGSYKSDSSSMSLDNWAFLQTKQHPELKKFLAEFGFQHLSDWAMLNNIGVKQMAQLAPRNRNLIEVFHAVYRRDRRQQKVKRLGKCPNPTQEQLQEMQTLLRERNCIFPSAESVFAALKKVASLLRQYDIWSYREPLEIYEPDSGNYAFRNDLPTENSNNAIASEEQELLNFLQDSLNKALVTAIEQTISTRIAKLNKSGKYRPFAAKFVTGLELYYCQKKSLGEITPLLGFSNWSQARRVLNPGEILNTVRIQTVQQLLTIIWQKTQNLGLTDASPSANYLQSLSIQIEAFADEAVFQAATSEIKSGKHRDLQSLYAQKIRLYCQQSSS
ncbi:conserved hypothetical protein [Hyella patelloides LEGE 07179]|uniref:Uncharacterized protein n=1 Tax=Hyella patelloides LEGE 07179 TaxID=945734 RepID=A0A563VYB5_9CYAN|nr:hypothetical protein [Hyella patelloides]VEP16273.1 conserved hypothetical protein [Hyella patelloides LEGE 07179]